MAVIEAEPRVRRTLADFFERFGDVSPDRVRVRWGSGPATVQDVIDIRRHEGVLCELVEGMLVEKIMGFPESRLAAYIATLLNMFVIPRNLGIVTGADGAVELVRALVRIPDVAFISWNRVPHISVAAEPIPQIVPNLAVEVLSPSNTPSEMSAKRSDYFAAGTDRVWEVDPDSRTVVVYSSPTDFITLNVGDALMGDPALPDFSVPVAELFAELDRRPSGA